ncbi:MAG: hypothetical protein HOK99_07780 [Betaproteobacteria bacterium]|nr:hypothetical protein [Betaproteobacteria bacterium]
MVRRFIPNLIFDTRLGGLSLDMFDEVSSDLRGHINFTVWSSGQTK